ncbi:MAG: DUF2800 domain-containing protein [Akkermansia sp.]|nr:DUF2800 domain-containing protein [Akkermansia sp.]MBR5184787.1 DUF2800 domain-containing protein [Akkermansia sp.]
MNEDDVRKGLPSASGLQRLIYCPGSWLAEQACPELEESEAAAMGTRLHKHMEEGTLPEDADEREAVEWCRLMEEAVAKDILGKHEELFREKRLWDDCQRFSGQADKALHDGCAALVVDYKFGRIPVEEADRNAQLYALAVLLFDNYSSIEVVYGCILQPYVSRQRPAIVRFGREDLVGLRRYIYGRLDAALVPGAKLCPGEAQCRYCRAAASCPALGLQVQKAAGLELTRWEQWSVEDRRKAWDAAKLAKRYADAIERKVRADLEAGVELPGLELAPGKAAFTVADVGGAFAHLNAMLDISGEEFVRCCKVGISELDKLVHAKLAAQAPEGVKQTTKASREWLRWQLEDFGSVKYTAGSIRLKA